MGILRFCLREIKIAVFTRGLKRKEFSMKMRVIYSMSAAIVAMFLIASATLAQDAKNPLDSFSDEQKAKLLSGEAIYEYVIDDADDEGEKAYGRAVALVNAPAEQGYKIFCDFEKEYLYFPRMTLSKVLDTKGNVSLVYKELDFTVITMRYTHFMTRNDKDLRVDFEKDPDGVNDFKESAGFFQFVKIDDKRCLFIYGLTKGEMSIPVPGFIKNYATSKDLPNIVLSVKKRVESGGTWQKDD